jgi:NO-binding membrane sensor protein with MHYT domain
MVTYLRQEKHGEYVILSFALAFIGAYSAINICDQFRLCVREKSKFLSRRALMLFMAINIGGITIWAMHFVGKFINFQHRCSMFKFLLTHYFQFNQYYNYIYLLPS